MDCEGIKCVKSCPNKNWEQHGSQCFLWSDDQKYWDDAERFCQEEGGHLASVASEEVNEYLSKKKNEKRSFDRWLGGSDKEREGTWNWSDGSPWNFTKWSKNQPSNGTEEHCLKYIGHHKTWGDYPCKPEKDLCAVKSFAQVRMFFWGLIKYV